MEHYVERHEWGISILVAHPAWAIVDLTPEFEATRWERVVHPTDDQDWFDIGSWREIQAAANATEDNVDACCGVKSQQDPVVVTTQFKSTLAGGHH